MDMSMIFQSIMIILMLLILILHLCKDLMKKHDVKQFLDLFIKCLLDY